ncbi:hypothetical protein [Streptantibioticus ferralitis]|uniref:PH domain-containing protein n=1 Tax=Streptantibioticus ferralitis TaxID=236510 RepID=A0ABT5Z5V3_9ACTN|nr:hypothetical protein [Streptantibioticus ferralitis]MDF2259208.1 hypothetical protein [Streptantibioticus ferralitis]
MNTATTYVTQAVDKHSAKITDLSDRLLWVAGLLAFVALVYWLMWRAWHKRAARQSDLPELPEIPADLGEPPLLTMSGRYHASTTAGDWLDRIAARGLGTRSLVDLALTEQGVAVHRPAAADFFIPAAALRGARLDKGIAGKVVPEGGLLVITWQHGDRLIDSGFRSEHPAEHPAWVDALQRLVQGATAEDLNTTKEGAR